MILVDDWLELSNRHADCSMCMAIKACFCGVGLCDPGDYANAFALGMLQGLRKNYRIFSDRSDPDTRPLGMSSAQTIDYSPSNLKKDISDGMRRFLRLYLR